MIPGGTRSIRVVRRRRPLNYQFICVDLPSSIPQIPVCSTRGLNM